MTSKIKYLTEGNRKAKPLYDISGESSFDALWRKAESLCTAGCDTRFVITQKDDIHCANTLLCWFAVFTNDKLTLLWQGSIKVISSIKAEIEEWKTTESDVENHLSPMPNNDVICYHNGNDVRFLTQQSAYIGTLETELDDWKSYIYL